jgi:hypothetical protein
VKCKILSHIDEELHSMSRSPSTFVRVNLESCDGLGRAGNIRNAKRFWTEILLKNDQFEDAES